jgi:hypothetical protein
MKENGHNRKRRSKIIPACDDIILYLKDTKDSTKKLLDLANTV